MLAHCAARGENAGLAAASTITALTLRGMVPLIREVPHACMLCCRGSNADVAAAATITDLQAASKALQGKGGIDPFSGAMQVAGPFPVFLCPPRIAILLLSLHYCA